MKKKKRNPVLMLVVVLFGVYIALYYMAASGYYEYKEYNKMIITEEAMKRFESDVNEGKDISINDYLTSNFKDYSNKISDLGLEAGDAMEKLMTEGLGGLFKIVSKLVTN